MQFHSIILLNQSLIYGENQFSRAVTEIYICYMSEIKERIITKVHHKILKHLLTLFFVLILLSILGMQWMAVENGPSMKEAMQKESEFYRFVMPKHPENPEKTQLEIKIY